MKKYFESPDTLIGTLKQSKYILNESLAVAVYLSLVRKKPLFLEGEAGVGKTEIAKILSQVLNKNLIRLQCYEGLDINQAAYEWNYGQQIIALQSGNKEESDLFSKKYLIERPLLKAIQGNEGENNILLIDELDRADEAFEAYLLEILSDWQLTIPELGTIVAKTPPIVIITSNNLYESARGWLGPSKTSCIICPVLKRKKSLQGSRHSRDNRLGSSLSRVKLCSIRPSNSRLYNGSIIKIPR